MEPTAFQLSLAKARQDAGQSAWLCAVLDEHDDPRAAGLGETPADAEAHGQGVRLHH
jgi:hypothetical protein